MAFTPALKGGALATIRGRYKAGRSTAITFLTAAGLPASKATELVTGVADRRAATDDGKV